MFCSDLVYQAKNAQISKNRLFEARGVVTIKNSHQFNGARKPTVETGLGKKLNSALTKSLWPIFGEKRNSDDEVDKENDKIRQKMTKFAKKLSSPPEIIEWVSYYQIYYTELICINKKTGKQENNRNIYKIDFMENTFVAPITKCGCSIAFKKNYFEKHDLLDPTEFEINLAKDATKFCKGHKHRIDYTTYTENIAICNMFAYEEANNPGGLVQIHDPVLYLIPPLTNMTISENGFIKEPSIFPKSQIWKLKSTFVISTPPEFSDEEKITTYFTPMIEDANKKNPTFVCLKVIAAWLWKLSKCNLFHYLPSPDMYLVVHVEKTFVYLDHTFGPGLYLVPATTKMAYFDMNLSFCDIFCHSFLTVARQKIFNGLEWYDCVCYLARRFAEKAPKSIYEVFTILEDLDEGGLFFETKYLTSAKLCKIQMDERGIIIDEEIIVPINDPVIDKQLEYMNRQMKINKQHNAPEIQQKFINEMNNDLYLVKKKNNLLDSDAGLLFTDSSSVIKMPDYESPSVLLPSTSPYSSPLVSLALPLVPLVSPSDLESSSSLFYDEDKIFKGTGLINLIKNSTISVRLNGEKEEIILNDFLDEEDKIKMKSHLVI